MDLSLIKTKAYKIVKFDHEYKVIFKHLQLQTELLTAQSAKRVRDTYDELMDLYVKKMAKSAKECESQQTL